MPTGYTAKLYDGEDVSFKDFLLGCAHAFNFRMRDLPIGSEIPEPKMDDYYVKAVERDTERLAAAKALTIEQAQQAASDTYVAALNAAANAELRRLDHVKQYNKMVAEVRAWVPPTPAHQGIKDFMLQQLQVTYEFDLNPYKSDIVLQTPEQYIETEIASAQRSLDYSLEHLEEQTRKFNEGVEWVNALTKSIEEL